MGGGVQLKAGFWDLQNIVAVEVLGKGHEPRAELQFHRFRPKRSTWVMGSKTQRGVGSGSRCQLLSRGRPQLRQATRLPRSKHGKYLHICTAN